MFGMGATTTTAAPLTNQFASDNAAGICPEAWEALAEANRGYSPGYGDDSWTRKACDRLRELFEIDCEIFFSFTGTAANSMAIGHLCASYQSVICHEMAHVETDECGGPEFFTNGTKLLLATGANGKLTPEGVQHVVDRRNDIHYPRPRVVSITQATEAGTVYNVNDLSSLSETARKNKLHVHMDGARFSNAVATLNVAPKEITWKVGVDVLCFGGTKNGMPVGDAVIFFDKRLAEGFDCRCKQAGQLASKMRFLSAPWVGMFQGDAWLKHARHANCCAARLLTSLREIPGVEVMYPVQANSVFLKLPESWIKQLRDRGLRFYTFIGGGARFMCSWNTTDAEIDALIATIREVAAQS